MLNTDEAFDKFRKRLELSETERRDAARRHSEVRECIRAGFDLKTDFLSGSYKVNVIAELCEEVLKYLKGIGNKEAGPNQCGINIASYVRGVRAKIRNSRLRGSGSIARRQRMPYHPITQTGLRGN